MPHLNQKQYIWLATLIMCAAAATRLIGLYDTPPGLHFDEAANASITSLIAFDGYRPIFIPDFTGKEVLWFYMTALLVRFGGGSVFVLRLASVFMGLLTVAVAGWVVRVMFTKHAQWLSLFTMAVLANAFWLAVLNRIMFRANAQPLIMALAIGALFTAWRLPHDDGKRWVWLVTAGVFTGLSAHTYLAVRLLPIVLVLLWIAALFTYSRLWRGLLELGLYGLVSGLVVLPLGLYFMRNPERFFTRVNQVGAANMAEVWAGWQAALGMLFIEGDPLLRFNIPGRPLFGWVLGALFVMGWAFSVREIVTSETGLDRVRSIMLAIWPVVFLAPTALATNAIAPSNLRAIGLVPFIALYPVMALVWLLSLRSQRGLVLGVLGAVLILTGGSTLYSLGIWGDNPRLYYDYDSHVAAMGRYLDQRAPDVPAYVGTQHYDHPTLLYLSQRGREASSLFEGEALVLPDGGEALFAVTRDAGMPSVWRDTLAPYRLAASLGPDAAVQFEVYQIDESLPLLATGSQANFGQIVQLEGAQFYPATSGGVAQLDATWLVIGQPPRTDYVFTAEVCDQWGWCWQKTTAEGAIERSINDSYLASEWQVGERIVTHFAIPLPFGIPPGDYEVQFGVFSTGEQAPLPTLDETGGFSGIVAAVEGLKIGPSTVGDTREIPVQIRREQAIAPDIVLFGHDLPQMDLRSGDTFNLAVYWLALEDLNNVRSVRLYLNDDLFLEREPVRGTYPTSEWEAGELVIDRYIPRLPRDLPAGEYVLAVEIGDSWRYDLSTLAVREPTRKYELPATFNEVDAAFTNGIALAGYSVEGDVQPGSTVTVRWAWRTDALQEWSYTIFTHLIDSEGRIVAQQDRQPIVNGELYPFDLFAQGEVAADDGVTLTLPPDLPPGEYMLRVGLYIPENGENILLSSGDSFLVLPIP